MKKLLLIGLVMVVSSTISLAQQDPQFTQNMYNRLFPNPAVAGSNGSICATVLGREQWVGFEGRPSTYLFTIHGPVKLLKGGLGLAVAQDGLGQIQDFHLKASYAYHHSLPFGEISGGIAIGMLNKSIGSDWVTVNTDPATDPTIAANGLSTTAFDMDLGAYFTNDRLYAGVSSTHVPSADLAAATNSTESFKVARHYYLMAGYSLDLTPSIELQPSVFVKSDGAHAQIDVSGVAVYNQMFFGGLSYRAIDAISVMAGVDYQLGGSGVAGGTLRFGYAYDITTSSIRTGSTGSHEILLNYCFRIPKKVKLTRHKSVRYL